LISWTGHLAHNDRPEWVFGYGSLMWRPGFSFEESHAATLQGFHRAFCIYSHIYRGTPERPGLVLGLDAGGSCSGTGFRIADCDWDTVVDYLNERELVGYAYIPRILPITVGSQSVTAYTFIADSTHGQYAGDLGLEKTADIIMAATGNMGLNRDYLINTVRELEAHGYQDIEHHELLTRVQHLTGLIDQGGGI
jgi:glutathione-specific gamma-glutamylcyclotransferase